MAFALFRDGRRVSPWNDSLPPPPSNTRATGQHPTNPAYTALTRRRGADQARRLDRSHHSDFKSDLRQCQARGRLCAGRSTEVLVRRKADKPDQGCQVLIGALSLRKENLCHVVICQRGKSSSCAIPIASLRQTISLLKGARVKC